jgi:hypothetical protein
MLSAVVLQGKVSGQAWLAVAAQPEQTAGQGRDLGEPAVGVEEEQPLPLGLRRTAIELPAAANGGDAHHAVKVVTGKQSGGNLPRLVTGAAVTDQDFESDALLGGKVAEQTGQRCGLVPGRDDH